MILFYIWYPYHIMYVVYSHTQTYMYIYIFILAYKNYFYHRVREYVDYNKCNVKNSTNYKLLKIMVICKYSIKSVQCISVIMLHPSRKKVKCTCTHQVLPDAK